MTIVYHTIYDKESLINKLRKKISEYKQIKIAILFGSILDSIRVRDIDIAFYAIPRLSLKEILLIGYEIEECIGIPVDFVPLEELPPVMQYHVLSKGIPIIVRDQVLYVELVHRALSAIEDLKIKLRMS